MNNFVEDTFIHMQHSCLPESCSSARFMQVIPFYLFGLFLISTSLDYSGQFLTSRQLVSRMLLLPLVDEISPQLLKQASWCLLLPATGSGSLGQDGKDFQRFEKQEEKIPWGRRLGLGVVEGWRGGGGGGGGRRASSPSPCSTASACPAPPASPSSPHSVLPLGGSVEQWRSKMCVCVCLQMNNNQGCFILTIICTRN